IELQTNTLSYREFIQNKLKHSLEAGKLYKLSFYYNVASGSALGNCPPNQFGVYGALNELNDNLYIFYQILLLLVFLIKINLLMILSIGLCVK
ncbi:MAG: hypothetical protein EBS86_10940, partial [Crocinitomicaceae bacterium]|nr:hypothetical protein [Crocinitomicaceae bacterium]